MNQPQAFREFAAYCIYAEEVDEDMARQDEIVKEAYLRLSPQQKMEVRTYIDHLLTVGHSESELWDIWNNSGADFVFFPSPRQFLTQTLAMMKGKAR